MTCGGKVAGVIGMVFGVAICLAAPAKATTLDYQFAFLGQAFGGSGDILVDAQADVLGGYDIRGVNGVILGPVSGPITGVIGTAPNLPGQIFTDSSGQQWTYDDVLFTNGAPAFDYNGLLISFGQSYTANLYSIGPQIYFSTDLANQPVQLFQPGDAVHFELAATPLPTTLPMFLAALIGLWALRRHSRAVA
jgi:hypothetical protein